MKPMEEIPYQVEIITSQVPNRLCRFYQEQIYEYYQDGRARYEWDRIRQDYILYGDTSIGQICASCPLNILLGVEGCKGDLFEFEVFLKAATTIWPGSLLMQKNALNASFSFEETQELLKEIESMQEQGKNINWPVAQVFSKVGVPLTSVNSFKYNNLVFYEWSGDENRIFFTTNRGYHIGLSSEGIILKKNYGETLPDQFLKVTRKGFRVVGQAVSGKIIPVPLNRTKLPEWFPDAPDEDTELRFTELPVSGVFRDIFNMIIVYGQTALDHFTGINIFSEFYRRA
ncbi:MAG: hypothetical protein K8T10_19295 [Candidatus Eremiobacteraeota bacterium]|nr:hypothetical protein [Candidatus Eremiobacteraeota bacterium]